MGKNQPAYLMILSVAATFWALVALGLWLMPASRDLYETYNIILLTVLAGVSWYSLLRSPPEHPTWENRLTSWHWLGLFLALTVVLFVFVPYVPNHNIAMDNHSHAIFSMDRPMSGGAAQQQPPLGYLASHFFQRVVGLNLVALQMNAALPFILSFVIFGWIGLRLRNGLAFLLVFTTLTATNGVLLYSFLEARPLSIALFSLALFSAAWIEALQYDKRVPLPTLIALALSAYYFQLSIGFQPVVIMGALTLIHGILWLRAKERRWLELGGALAAAIFLFLPVHLYISWIALKLHYFHTEPSKQLLGGLKQHWDILSNYFKQLAFWPVLVFVLAVSLYSLKKTQQRTYWVLGFLFLILTPLLHTFLFSFINWYHPTRYYTCLVALGLVLISLALTRLPRWWSWALAIVVSASVMKYNERDRIYLEAYHIRPKWQEVYKSIVATAKDRPFRVYVLGECLVSEFAYCNPNFIGLELFAPKEMYDSFPGRYVQALKDNRFGYDNGMVKDLLSPHTEPKVFYLVIENFAHELDAITDDPAAAYEVRHVENFLVVSSRNPLPFPNGVGALLEYAATRVPYDARNFYLHESLLRFYILTKNQAAVDRWAKDFEANAPLQASFQVSDKSRKRLTEIRFYIEHFKVYGQ